MIVEFDIEDIQEVSNQIDYYYGLHMEEDFNYISDDLSKLVIALKAVSELDTTELIKLSFILTAKSSLYQLDSIYSNNAYNIKISDLLELLDLSELVYKSSMDIESIVTCEDYIRHHVIYNLLSIAAVDDRIAAKLTRHLNLTSGVKASDNTFLLLVFSILSTGSLNDAVNILDYILFRIREEDFSAIDSLGILSRVNFKVKDTSSFGENVFTLRISNFNLSDSVYGRFIVKLGEDIYYCYVFTSDDFYPSIYTNYGFNSFVYHRGKYYGANSSGVFLLEGETDNNAEINTRVNINLGNLGTIKKKIIKNAYFGISGITPSIKVINENGSEDYYIISKRARISHGQSGTDWSFELTKIDKLDFIELYPIVLTRS